MNKIIIFIFCTVLLIAQKSEVGWGVGEIYLGVRGLSSNESVSFKMISKGGIWGGGPLLNSQYILNPMNPNYVVARIPKNDEQFIGNTNFNSFNWEKFRFILYDNLYDRYGYGLYTFYIEQYSAYFYLDYRDNNYSNYNNCNGHCADIWVKYEKSEDKFYYVSGDYDSNEGIDPDHESWVEIYNGQLLKIWELKGQNNNDVSSFPQYWQNSLAVIDENFHPKLIWSTDTNVNVTHYKFYRSISWIDEEEPSNDFVYLKQVNSNTGSFVDYSAVIGDKIKIWYKVKAFNGATEVEELNIVNHPYKYVVDWLGKSVILSIINNRPVLKFNCTVGDLASNEPEVFNIYRATKDYQNTFFSTSELVFSSIKEITHNPLSPDTIKSFIDSGIYIPSNKHIYYYIEAIGQTDPVYSSILGLRNSEFNWDENLYLTDDNNRPKLIWGPHPDYYYTDIVNYKIFHSFHMFGTPPGTFSLLATVNGNTV